MGRRPLPLAPVPPRAPPRPAADDGSPAPIGRPRIDALLAGEWRIAVFVAPAGAGKTIAARQWAASHGMPVATVRIDRIGDDVAHERLQDAARTLAAAPATLIVDCPQPIGETPVWPALTSLVDELGGRLRVILTCQSDPPLPIGRWRAAGLVRTLRMHDLCFSDAEAVDVAASLRPQLAPSAVIDLNHRLDGWPLAVALALMAVGDGWSPGDELPGPTVETLVAETLDRLAPRRRDVVLGLAVFESFDDALVTSVIGPDARPVVTELRRRHLVEPADPGPGQHLHGLLREVLDTQLAWRDPERHAQLHRHAARYWQHQGRLDLAYRHLASIREPAPVDELVVEPARRLAERGDRAGLGRLLGALPRPPRIDDPAIAVDLAGASLLGGDRRQVLRWLQRADTLGLAGRAAVRAHVVRARLAVLDGRLGDVADELGAVAAAGWTDRDDLVERDLGLTAAALALARADAATAQGWLDRVGGLDLTSVERDVTLAGLQAWHDDLVGLARRAAAGASAALSRATELSDGPQAGAVDAAVAAAWALLRTGDLAGAESAAQRALADAATHGHDWHTVRAAAVAAEVQLAWRRPAAALETVAAARRRLSFPQSELAATLVEVDAAAHWWLGDVDRSASLLAITADRPRVRLLQSALALHDGDDAVVAERLADHASWLLPDRLEASLLLAVASGDSAGLVAVVEDAASIGLLLPFLRFGPRIEAALLRLPLETLHPQLIDHLRSCPHPAAAPASLGMLTRRERSILALLPSHLSYHEIAARLDLSVNTVKGNLKSVYRKLDVTGRADAVEVARRAGLLGPPHA